FYESIQQERTVLMKTIEVPEIKEDPIPELGRDLPRVEFLPPLDAGKSQVGSGTARLPVATKHRVGYVFFDNALKVLRPLAPRKRSAGNPASFRREVKHI